MIQPFWYIEFNYCLVPLRICYCLEIQMTLYWKHAICLHLMFVFLNIIILIWSIITSWEECVCFHKVSSRFGMGGTFGLGKHDGCLILMEKNGLVGMCLLLLFESWIRLRLVHAWPLGLRVSSLLYSNLYIGKWIPPDKSCLLWIIAYFSFVGFLKIVLKFIHKVFSYDSDSWEWIPYHFCCLWLMFRQILMSLWWICLEVFLLVLWQSAWEV